MKPCKLDQSVERSRAPVQSSNIYNEDTMADFLSFAVLFSGFSSKQNG
jgi:hypothetical protein